MKGEELHEVCAYLNANLSQQRCSGVVAWLILVTAFAESRVVTGIMQIGMIGVCFRFLIEQNHLCGDGVQLYTEREEIFLAHDNLQNDKHGNSFRNMKNSLCGLTR